MCGIVGIYSNVGVVPQEKLTLACQLIQHRGPDASGVYFDDEIGLGHQRLSIIDLSDAANQPMYDETENVVLVYNGELYNYRELRKRLEASGHTFVTTGDTEVLLRMYLKYGTRCLPYLEGMFAFALWDKRARQLFLARDPLGIKPLYYRKSAKGLLFASEIKALLALDDDSPRVNRQALHDYLTFRYTIAPLTMFDGVEKLPPAHSLVISRRGFTIDRYWSPDYQKPEQRTDAEWEAELRQKFLGAVTSHLVSDVPVGILLSGGLDSSLVAAAAQALVTKRLKTFTVAFDEGGAYDERPYARTVAQYLGSDHYEISVSASDFANALPAYIWHMDEPVADPASIPLYYVSQLAAQHVKVVLSGEGSDELLAGYNFWSQFKGYNRLKVFKKIPSFLRMPCLAWFNDHLFHSDKVARYLEMSQYPLSAYGQLMPAFQDDVFSEEEKYSLYRPEITKDTSVIDSVDKVRAAYRDAEPFEFLDQMLFVSMTQWLPEDLLTKADKMTMAHSLELRVPFLDYSLVNFITRMPTHLKVRKNGEGYAVKYALKTALRDMVPREILDREKLGFAVPYARWFKTGMRDFLYDVLLSKSAYEEGIFNPEAVQSLLRDIQQPSPHDAAIWNPQAKKVWSLLVFELWRKEFRVSCA